MAENALARARPTVDSGATKTTGDLGGPPRKWWGLLLKIPDIVKLAAFVGGLVIFGHEFYRTQGEHGKEIATIKRSVRAMKLELQAARVNAKSMCEAMKKDGKIDRCIEPAELRLDGESE